LRECDFHADLNSKSNRQRINEVKKIIEAILRNVTNDKNLLDRLSNLKFEISKREYVTAYLRSNYKIPKEELENVKACYVEGTIYFLDDVCIQVALHEFLHSIRNEKWNNLNLVIKEGLIEFISALILYTKKNENEYANKAFTCMLCKSYTTCSIKQRLGYSKGYAYWASIYLKLLSSCKNECTTQLFNDFLQLLTEFNSNNAVLNSILIRLQNKNSSYDICYILDKDMRDLCIHIEYEMSYNIFQ